MVKFMYGISIETMHMINRIDAETRRRALYNPELRKSSVIYREQRDEKKQIEEWKKRILDEA